MCILFYSKREAGLLKMIERTARITFERIGTPQTDDLIGAAAKSAKQMLEEVNPQVSVRVLKLFLLVLSFLFSFFFLIGKKKK